MTKFKLSDKVDKFENCNLPILWTGDVLEFIKRLKKEIVEQTYLKDHERAIMWGVIDELTGDFNDTI